MTLSVDNYFHYLILIADSLVILYVFCLAGDTNIDTIKLIHTMEMSYLYTTHLCEIASLKHNRCKKHLHKITF